MNSGEDSWTEHFTGVPALRNDCGKPDANALESMADAAFEAAMDLECHVIGSETPETVAEFLTSIRAFPNCESYLSEVVPCSPYDRETRVERISVLVSGAIVDETLLPAAAAAILAAHDAFLLASYPERRGAR